MSEAKGSGSKRRFRATSIIIAVASMCLMMGSSLGIIIPSSSTNASAQSVTSTPFTYEAYTGSFPSDDVPTHYQAAVGKFTTDWGAIGLGTSFSIIGSITFGVTPIPCWLSIYDTEFTYWYYNMTYSTGRPFSTAWTNWFMIRNDTNVGIFERYAEVPHAWSGTTHEFNLTIRIAILKHDAVLRVDTWLRILNASSPIKQYLMNPIMYDVGTGGTDGKDASRSMGYRYAPGYALGVIGVAAGAVATPSGGNPQLAFNRYQTNVTAHNLSETLHGTAITVISDTVAHLTMLADKVGSMWTHYESTTDTNFVIARNAVRFDALDYFPSTGYTVYPSEVSETIYAHGVTTVSAFDPNPLLNYAKTPFVTFYDDHGNNATGEWAFSTARRYDIALSLPTPNAYLSDAEMNADVNLSLERSETLFEITDHNYNHTAFYGSGTYLGTWATENYYEQKKILDFAQDKWDNYTTTIPMQSEALAYNAWSNGTWDAMGSAGIKNLRLTQDTLALQQPRDYNLTGNPVWVVNFQSQYIDSPATSGTLRYMENYGFHMHQGHDTEFFTVPQQTAVELYWSWVQNQTELLSVTFSQFSDLWHHRIHYTENDGFGEVNPTQATTNHKLVLTATPGSFWYDVTNGSLVPFEVNATVMTMIGEQGHVYRELPIQIVATGPAVVSPISYLPTPETVASWSVIGTAGSTVTFTLTGLESGAYYLVAVDGEHYQTIEAVGGAISFTYSGPWSEHDFEVSLRYGTQISPLVSLVFFLFIVGVVVSVIGAAIYPLRHKEESLKMGAMVGIAIYIVLAMTFIIVLYSIIFG